MKLSKLTKMAAFAFEAQESGDAVTRNGILEHPIETFPKSLLATCRVDRIRKASRDAAADRQHATASEAAGAFVSTATLDGLAYRFDANALAALVKAARPADTIFLGVAGYKFGLKIPVRALRALDRVRPLKRCQVHMTSPVYGQWRFIVQWSDKGYWNSPKEAVEQKSDMIPAFVPSMTEMVSRELGCEAA